MGQQVGDGRGVTARPKRVLLAWETGAGRTHYANLLDVARHLRKAGVECLATLHELSAADREFAAIGVSTVQNFLWPSQKTSSARRNSFRTNGFTDLLALTGFARGEAVAACIAHYDGLFSLFRPDLILADHAYGAVLAGRDHLPIIAMASATHMPPIVGDGFPLIPGRETPNFPVEALLSGINAGLGRAGRFPLRDIADLLRSITLAPLGPAEFDIYRKQRTGRVLPPLVPDVPAPSPRNAAHEIFAYIHGDSQKNEALMSALEGLDVPLRVYIPGIEEKTRRRLAHATIAEEAVPVADIVARSRCVVHHGGTQLSAVCIATGMPQVILGKHLDNQVAAGFVEAAGLGAGCDIANATTDWIAEQIRRGYGDEDLRRRCADTAPEYHARWFAKDTAAILADYVLDKLSPDRKSATVG